MVEETAMREELERPERRHTQRDQQLCKQINKCKLLIKKKARSTPEERAIVTPLEWTESEILELGCATQ